MSEDLVDNIIASLRCFFSVCLSRELRKENNSKKKKERKRGGKRKLEENKDKNKNYFSCLISQCV